MPRWWQRLTENLTYGTYDTPMPTTVPLYEPAVSQPAANTIVTVDSRDSCFPFEVHLDVRYAVRAGSSVADPFLIAKAGVDRRVRALAATFALTEAARLRAELEVELSQRIGVESTGVISWASCLAVIADDRLVHRIKQYEGLRRQRLTRLWAHEAEEAEVTYLSSLIADPRRATAWWFTKHPDDITGLLETARTFTALREQLSSDDRDPAKDGIDDWNTLLGDFHRRADPAARLLLAHQINQVLMRHDLDDLAKRARLLDGDLIDD